MITGAIIFFVGFIVGMLMSPHYELPIVRQVVERVKKVVKNEQAIVVEVEDDLIDQILLEQRKILQEDE